MELENIHKLVLCCSCGQPFKGENDVLIAMLPIAVSWNYPTHGNILQGTKNLAIAYVCQACEDSKAKIKKVVEFNGDTVIYHSL